VILGVMGHSDHLTVRSSVWSRSRCRCGSRRASSIRIRRPTHERLAHAGDELGLALDELREIARGLHLAVLTDQGLRAAVESLAGRVPVPVEIEDILSERLPEPVEAAAYQLIAEALTNVAKYSQATEARVAIAAMDGTLVVEHRTTASAAQARRRGQASTTSLIGSRPCAAPSRS
jgi:signal transduction histidine kinase